MNEKLFPTNNSCSVFALANERNTEIGDTKMDEITEFSTAAPSFPNILHLNDDCLYNIFARLNVKEQLQLTKTCERFRWIVLHMIWRKQFAETRTISAETDALSYEEYQELFHYIVEYMQKFTIADNKHLVFITYLPPRYTQRPELAFYLSFEFPCLVSLECFDRRLHDGLLRLVSENCPKLQVLRVTSDYITGAHIKDMRNLRELYLPKCNLATEHLREISKHLNLTHLDITGSAVAAVCLTENRSYSKLRQLKLSENNIEIEFATHCDELESLRKLIVTELYEEPLDNTNWPMLCRTIGTRITALHIYNASSTSTIRAIAACASDLTSLQKLYIKAAVPDRCLHLFAQLPRLHELYIYSYSEFTPSAFANFVRKSQTLRFVDLVCCENLFDLRLQWIFDIIEILHSYRSSKVPLALNIAHSELMYFRGFIEKIKKQIMQDHRYINQSLLTITFNAPPVRYEQTLDTFLELYLK